MSAENNIFNLIHYLILSDSINIIHQIITEFFIPFPYKVKSDRKCDGCGVLAAFDANKKIIPTMSDEIFVYDESPLLYTTDSFCELFHSSKQLRKRKTVIIKQEMFLH